MNKHIKQLIQQLLPTCENSMLAEQEAWWLVEAVTNKSKSGLLSNPAPLSQAQIERLDALVMQRVQEHKPLQYLLGSVPFCGLTINVRPPTLIPRPETEEWTTWLIDCYKKSGIETFAVLDLCTGTGCIGLAIAKHFSGTTIIGVDLKQEAIVLANENKHINKLTNISFIASDLYENLPTNFTCHLIVSNPPYLSFDEYTQLDTDVRNWEDRDALVGDDNGMIFYRQILQHASKYLRKLPQMKVSVPNVILEVGPAQDIYLEQLLSELHIAEHTIHKDMQSKKRWVSLVVPIEQ